MSDVVWEKKQKTHGKGAKRKEGMHWQGVECLEVEKAEAQRRFAMQEKAKVELVTGVNTGEKQEITPIFRNVPICFSAAVDLSLLGRLLVAWRALCLRSFVSSKDDEYRLWKRSFVGCVFSFTVDGGDSMRAQTKANNRALGRLGW